MVDRYRVAPEHLSGDAPVLDRLHPPVEGERPSVGVDPNAAFPDRPHGGFGERADAHEPLGGEAWLHHRVRAFGPRHGVAVGQLAQHVPLRAQAGEGLLTSRVAVETPEALRHPVAREAPSLVEHIRRHR